MSKKPAKERKDTDPALVYTTVRTREELRSMGRMDEKFDDVLQRLIKFWKMHHERSDSSEPEQAAIAPGGETQDEVGVMA